MKGDGLRTTVFYLLGILVTVGSTQARAAGHPAERPHVFFGEVRTDTVSATPEEVFPEAIKAFTDDGWVAKLDTLHSMVATDWREFHHPLAKLLYGKLMARGEVVIKGLDDHRTVLFFRGGIASPSDIESNPAFALAKAAYYEGVRGYYRDLHAGLAERLAGKNRVP
jgi:hypothetical protein